MSLAATSTDIANMALDMIGDAPIVDIDSTQSEIAKLCKRNYRRALLTELRSNTWVFAKELVTLVQNSVETPHGRYKYSYDLPVRAVRALRPKDALWMQTGRQLWAVQTGTLKVWIVSSDIGVGDFDALFVDTVASKMAMYMMERRTQSANKAQLATRMYEQALSEAVLVNAIETPAEPLFSDAESQYVSGHHGYSVDERDPRDGYE